MNEFDLLSGDGLDDLNASFEETVDETTQEVIEEDGSTKEEVEEGEFKYFPDAEEEAAEDIAQTSSVLSEYLRQLGVTDPSKVLWDSEDGNGPVEVNFDELPQEDQLSILQSYNINKVLDENEISTINYLRENEVTLEEYTQYIQRQAVEQYVQSQQAQITVNDLSDEELFKLDLAEQNKYVAEEQRMTQEEIDEYWDSLQSSPALQKQLKILRETYLDSEKRLLEEQEIVAEQSRNREYEELAGVITELSKNIDTIEDITLEDDDKRTIEELLLKRDVNGVTGLAKALNDPQTLYTTAWFLTKGSEAFDMIKTYYNKKIQEVEKSAFEAGRNSVKSKTISSSKPTDRQLITNKKPRLEIGKHDI